MTLRTKSAAGDKWGLATSGGEVPAGTLPATGQIVLAEQILNFLQSKGRTEVKVRWIRQQTLRGKPSTEAIQAALDATVALGKGRWADTRKQSFIRA